MYVTIRKKGYTFYRDTDESKVLLRIYDEKLLASKRKSGKHADDKLDVHILAPESEEDAGETLEKTGNASTELPSTEDASTEESSSEKSDGQGENA